MPTVALEWDTRGNDSGNEMFLTGVAFFENKIQSERLKTTNFNTSTSNGFGHLTFGKRLRLIQEQHLKHHAELRIGEFSGFMVQADAVVLTNIDDSLKCFSAHVTPRQYVSIRIKFALKPAAGEHLPISNRLRGCESLPLATFARVGSCVSIHESAPEPAVRTQHSNRYNRALLSGLGSPWSAA